jgi:regulatory LuxR family protein
VLSGERRLCAGVDIVARSRRSSDPLVSANRIMDHLARRLADIERVTADDVASFEDSLVRYTQTGEPGTGDGILADLGDRERATPLFMETVQALGERPQRELLGEEMVRASRDTLFRVWNRRPYLTVSSVPVTLHVLEGGAGAEVEWRGDQLFVAAASDLTPHATSGSYDARLIARALFISEATVKTHLGRIYGKLGVETRAGAVAVAKEQRLLP